MNLEKVIQQLFKNNFMVYKEKIKKIEGEKNVEIFVFTLSTCGWCRRAKDLLDNLGVEYSYIDVDLLDEEDMKEVEDILEKFNSDGFPTIIIDNTNVLQGFDEDKLKRALQNGKN